METIKPSINVRYSVEAKVGAFWEEQCAFTLLRDAIDSLEKQKKNFPYAHYRLVRSEWEVIG
jgi:hypothetical protein